MRLFRPVGVKELELIAASAYKAFPPRFEWQPIFYPVLFFDYAKQIATEWNLSDKASGYSGFVTMFEVEDEFVSRYETQQVGGSQYLELWVPSEELEAFNDHIIGQIAVVASFYGEAFEGEIDEQTGLPLSVLSHGPASLASLS